MPTLNGALREYESHFTESGDIFRNAAYFAIKVQMPSQVSYRRASIWHNKVPSSSLPNAWLRALLQLHA